MVVRKPTYKKWWLDFQGVTYISNINIIYACFFLAPRRICACKGNPPRYHGNLPWNQGISRIHPRETEKPEKKLWGLGGPIYKWPKINGVSLGSRHPTKRGALPSFITGFWTHFVDDWTFTTTQIFRPFLLKGFRYIHHIYITYLWFGGEINGPEKTYISQETIQGMYFVPLNQPFRGCSTIKFAPRGILFSCWKTECIFSIF